MSSGMLSQELVDLIVDDVYCILGRQALLPLLRAAHCFGPRCRKYIYQSITLPVKVERGILDESLKKRNLRLLRILRHPFQDVDVARFVKRVTYNLCFDSDEVLCMVATSAWDALIRLKHLLVNVEDVSVDFGLYESLHGIYSSSAIHFNAPLAEAITGILPISAFTRLAIHSLKLHSLPLVGMISQFPHISVLDLDNITLDFSSEGMDEWEDPQLATCPPSTIRELCIGYTEILDSCIAGLENFFSGVRRLLLRSVTLNEDNGISSWHDLAEFLSTITQLDELYICLDRGAAGPHLPNMLRASSLWLELCKPANLTCLADSLVAEVDFPINLRRLAVVGYDYWDAMEWRVLATALCNPRLSKVEVAIVIDCASRVVDQRRIDETRSYFQICRAKVTVNCLSLENNWHLRRHALFKDILVD